MKDKKGDWRESNVSKADKSTWRESNVSMDAKITWWERYLTKEIGIEFKACLYFFGMLFYYCLYRLCIGVVDASILHMAEMIFLTYAMGYLQVFVLWNFDEADALGGREAFGIVLCTTLYTLVGHFCNWFDKNIGVAIGFFAYVAFMYICVYLVYKIRRKIDDKIMNDNLAMFKARPKSQDVES